MELQSDVHLFHIYFSSKDCKDKYPSNNALSFTLDIGEGLISHPSTWECSLLEFYCKTNKKFKPSDSIDILCDFCEPVYVCGSCKPILRRIYVDKGSAAYFSYPFLDERFVQLRNYRFNTLALRLDINSEAGKIVSDSHICGALQFRRK